MAKTWQVRAMVLPGDGATAALERDRVTCVLDWDVGDGVVRIERVVRVGGAIPSRGARKRPV